MGLEFFAGLILGIILNYLAIYIYSLIFCRRGAFEIDLTDPNKDVCKLVIGPLGDIYNKKMLILKIDTKMDSSQK